MKRKNQILFRKLSFLVATILMVSTTWAQQSISGKVVDDGGMPLPGVSVVEKGTTNGTATNIDGEYTLSVTADASLEFSFVGMLTVTETVNGRSIINVSMQADAIGLEEVVAVGYGTMKKSDLTGSISSVSSDDLEGQPITRIDQALQGRAAGVSVQQTSGSPKGSFKIRIRGSNSISGNNSPLYVVDGIVTGDISSLNLDDIESMEVLKDASATAIYGSRGANGVVLVSTKSGKQGKTKIEVSSNYGISNVTQKLPMMTPYDYALGVNAMEVAEAGNESAALFSQEALNDLETGLNPGEDWQDLFFKQAAYTNTQISISGGKDDVRYYISGSYIDRDGTIVDQNYKRYTMRANLNAELYKGVNLTLNTNYSREEDTGVRADFYAGLTRDLTTPAYNEDGDYNYSTYISGVGNGSNNPMIPIENNINDDFSDIWAVNAALDYKINNNFVLNISGGYTDRHNLANTFNSILNANNANGFVHNQKNVRIQNTNRLTYTLDKDDHNFKVDLVHEQQKYTTEWARATSSGMFTDQTTYKDLSIGVIQTTTNRQTNENLQSFLGRVNYSFLNRYLFTASLRADGSSKFQENNRWGYFPSGSVAWRVSEEGFLQDVSAISNLKIRASYGQIGSQAIDVFATRDIPVLGKGVNYFYEGGSGTVGVAPSAQMANSDLTWETTTQKNFAVDLGLWDSRLTATIDLYYKKTTDLLLDRLLPTFVGPTSITLNGGEVENKGIDIAIGAVVVKKRDWDVSTNFSFSRNKNEVLKLIDGLETMELGNIWGTGTFPVAPTVVQVGESLGTFRGYIFDGVWQLGEEEEAAVYNAKPGMAKYKDINDDGVISTDDIDLVGNGNPDFTFGWNWHASYKKLNLDFSILGSYGNDIYNFQRMRMMSLGSATYHATHADYLDRWTPDNPSDVPLYRSGTQTLSTQFLEDGSYVTMKNVTLSYDFELAKVDFIQNLNLSVSGENLFILTNYGGFDPETTATGNSDIDVGIDRNTYPINRTFSVGMKLTF